MTFISISKKFPLYIVVLELEWFDLIIRFWRKDKAKRYGRPRLKIEKNSYHQNAGA